MLREVLRSAKRFLGTTRRRFDQVLQVMRGRGVNLKPGRPLRPRHVDLLEFGEIPTPTSAYSDAGGRDAGPEIMLRAGPASRASMAPRAGTSDGPCI